MPSAREDPASVEAGLAELRRMFAADCSLGSSAPGFGVSPPVRSGAANGLVHDMLWRQASAWRGPGQGLLLPGVGRTSKT